jgi:hypothetical protein
MFIKTISLEDKWTKPMYTPNKNKNASLLMIKEKQLLDLCCSDSYLYF